MSDSAYPAVCTPSCIRNPGRSTAPGFVVAKPRQKGYPTPKLSAGFNTGLGLRFDIKFAVLRLDWGVQLHNPNNPAGERWIHNLRWKNTALNFGVGYPF